MKKNICSFVCGYIYCILFGFFWKLNILKNMICIFKITVTKILQDDMIDDVASFVAAAEVLKDRGAYKIYVMATHGLLSSDAPRLIDDSPIDEVCYIGQCVTSYIPLFNCFPFPSLCVLSFFLITTCPVFHVLFTAYTKMMMFVSANFRTASAMV